MVECCWFSIYAHEHPLWLWYILMQITIFPLYRYHAVAVLFSFPTWCMAKVSLHRLRRSLDTCRCWVNRTSSYSGKSPLWLTHPSWTEESNQDVGPFWILQQWNQWTRLNSQVLESLGTSRDRNHWRFWCSALWVWEETRCSFRALSSGEDGWGPRSALGRD